MPKKLIGTESYQVPRNADLGTAAFQDAESVNITGGVISLGNSSTTGYFQDTAISDVKPSLMLDFANTKTLDPRITFTRATTATYYDGKTVAKAEENLFDYSGFQTSSGWTTSNTSLELNTTMAPDGTISAAAFTGVSGSLSKGIRKSYPAAQTNIGLNNFTISIYAKAGSHSFLQIASNLSGWGQFNVNLLTGATGAIGNVTGSATAVGNGWYRIVVNSTYTYALGGSFWMYLVDSLASTEGQATTSTGNVYVWGLQMEQRAYATAYTPTTSSPITNYIPVLQTAAANVARFDHDPVTGESKGLLIEESRTNLLTNSSYYDGSYWSVTNVSVKNNAAIAPDGTNTAMQVVINTGSGRRELNRSHGGTVGARYTYSVFVKKYKEFDRILFSDSGTASQALYNLTTGTVVRSNNGAEATITNVGNDWYRISFSYTVQYSNIYMSFGTYDTTDSVFMNSSGDGLGGPYFWGTQFELGYFPTSYIPTTSAQVTRSADVASMSGTNFSNWFNQREGTTLIEFSTTKPAGLTTGVLSFWNSSYTNFIDFRNPLTQPYVAVYASSSTNITWNINSAVTSGSICKWALTYTTDDFTSSVNGNTISIYPGKTQVPVVNQLLIGNLNTTDTNNIGGYIRKIVFFPKRLTNAEVQEMSL